MIGVCVCMWCVCVCVCVQYPIEGTSIRSLELNNNFDIHLILWFVLINMILNLFLFFEIFFIRSRNDRTKERSKKDLKLNLFLVACEMPEILVALKMGYMTVEANLRQSVIL